MRIRISKLVKPTHEPRGYGGRLVKMRYEAVKRFDARESVIETIDYGR